MAEALTPDICVIGAGSEALAAAASAAALGVSVVLIATRRLGGDGLNYGSVPFQFLVAAGKRLYASATADVFGINTSPAVTFVGTRQHARQVIAAIAANETAERFTGLGVQVLFGAARFVNRSTVALNGETMVKAERFVIATGSAPAIPAIPGLSETTHFTSETIFNLAEPPSHLAVIGGDATGLALAQAFRRLGSQVSVIEQGLLLADEDAECAAVVVDAIATEGVEFLLGSSVTSVRQADGRIELAVRRGEVEEIISASHVLVAAGRVPRLDGLDLEGGRIRYRPSGIVVNRALRTSNHRVYAIGDAAGGPLLPHVANYHAGLVVRNALFRSPTKVSYNVVPRVIYTDPELAHVGITDLEAKRRRYSIRVLRSPYRENDRAQAERMLRGHVKVVTSRSGRILGVTIVGAQAGELIAPWTLAMDRGLDIRAMANVIAPASTLSEINRHAAMIFLLYGAEKSAAQRFIRWVRRLR